MIKPRIIVTGATGKTGSVVVSELLRVGYPVRAMVHREDARSAPRHFFEVVSVAALHTDARGAVEPCVPLVLHVAFRFGHSLLNNTVSRDARSEASRIDMPERTPNARAS